MPEIRPTLDLDLVWTAGHLPRKPIDADLFRLLEAIKRSGKLSVATAEVGLHYRQAWGLITTWSERMPFSIMASTTTFMYGIVVVSRADMPRMSGLCSSIAFK